MTRRDDLDNTLYVVRDNLERADAFLTAAEDLCPRCGRGSHVALASPLATAADEESLGLASAGGAP